MREEGDGGLGLSFFPDLPEYQLFLPLGVRMELLTYLSSLFPRTEYLVASWRDIEVVLQNDDCRVIDRKWHFRIEREYLLVQGDQS